jgi:hypothetical protein
MTDNANTATYDSKDAVQTERDLVKFWVDQINKSSADEKSWRDDAEKAEATYSAKDGARNIEFNIFHANIETIVPALYNSTPIPDVRRRYADKDPIGKVVSDILERSLSYCVDTYDFDGTMVSAIKDSEIVDRGVARVRYLPHFTGEGEEEALAYADVTCEHVLWKDFLRGPARYWGEVPWIAFRHYLSKDELKKLVDGIPVDDIPCNYSSDGRASDKQQDAKADIFRRAMVWEIWDRDNKKVLFICPDYIEKVLKAEGDPLELTNFFPVPKPLMAVEQSSTLVPVTPLKLYDKLVEELNTVTRRITKLVKTLRPRALYGGNALDIQAVANADDGELSPATDVMAFLQNGGLEKVIAWFPLDPTTNAIKTLYEQREIIKQTIYEVTGIADILRGSTDPNETLGAQQLKAQWGSLRIQRRQQEVARFARELFEIKSEIIATKFGWDQLSRMTGIQLLPMQQKQQAMQAAQMGAQLPPEAQKMLSQPSVEEVMQLLQDDVARNYRIDIESDSTIRNDLSRNQQTMNVFLQGTAQFATAMGPIIMTDPAMKPLVMEIYGSFARQFKLGRQAEDAIEAATEQAQKTAEQPPPPSPEAQKAEAEKAKLAAEMEMAKEQHAMEMQGKQAEMQGKLQLMQAQLEMKREEMNLKREEMNMKREEMALDMEMHQQKIALDAEAQQQKAAVDAQAMEHKAALNERTATLQAETVEHKHAVDMEMVEAKAKQAKAKPGARK